MKKYVSNNVFFGALCMFLLFVIMLLIVLKNKTASDIEKNAKKLDQLEQKIFTLSKQGFDSEQEFELAVHMQRMLTYANKLWFAGKAENDELVHFYIHELEENMQGIHDANIVYDGVVITPLMKQFGLNGVEAFEEDIESGKSFEESYQLLVTQCNNCHNSSKHAYIKIKIPESPSFDNQAYK